MTREGWHGIEVTFAPEVESESDPVEVTSALLFELGATGLEVKDQARPVSLVAAFSLEVEPRELLDTLSSCLDELHIVASLAPITFAPIDWANHWKEHFHPIGFGRLWVVPTWLEAPPGAEHVLRIDPSMAFGTGLHATTALCVERIVELAPQKTVLDVGTGTGILALAAILLGAERALATDDDPDALKVAAENAERNGAKDRIVLSGLPVAQITERFPLVVANILAGPLIDMAPALAARVAPGGKLALSGILATQAEEVALAYERAGLVGRDIVPRAEWVRIDFSVGS